MTHRLVAPLVLLAVVAATAAAAPAAPVFHAVDSGLCGFPLDVTVRTAQRPGQVATSALRFEFTGPAAITLKNASSGRSATLHSDGDYRVDTRSGSIGFRGHELWFWATGNQLPFLATDGRGSLPAPEYFLEPGTSRAHVIDPCALVSGSPVVTKPRATRAPWPLPAYTLSHIEYAGLMPIIGTLIRHDHAHLDIVVNGRKIPV